MLKSTSFIFDGVSSENYGVSIYFLDDEDKREISLGTDVEIIEDRLSKRTTPIHYGVDLNKAMSFPLTFGSMDYLEDYDVDAILSWLTGHQQYKWLEFVDGDHYVRYKCHLNNMQSIYINGLPVAFTCDVECDGQFAYEYPTTNEYTVTDIELPIDFFNKSSYNGYIYPSLKLEFGDDCNTFSIVNESDDDREFSINYFDRVVTNTAAEKYEYNSTIAEEISGVETNEGFISWQANTLPVSGNYSEIIKGETTWIALPKDGTAALYSQDSGATWSVASPALPHSGNWTGCCGDQGFVAICTDSGTAIASYSQTGMAWTQAVIELPISQDWRKVVFVETEGFMPDQYIAVGGTDSSIAAITSTGWAWQISSLPVAQEWRGAFAGNNRVVLVGGNSNIAVTSKDCIAWEQIELPKNAAWTAGCYGASGFVMVADTLYGSGSREPIALKSTDGKIWTVTDFPIGSWSNIIFGNSMYMAQGDRQFAYSLDANSWDTGIFPGVPTSIDAFTDCFICAIGTNKYLKSDTASAISGTFSFEVPCDSDYTISDVYISASIANTVSDTSYASNGVKLLATDVEAAGDDPAEESGGDYVAVTTDLRYGLGIDGVMMAATFNPISRVVTVNYIADTNHTSAINAPLTISVTYQATATTDLEYNGLIVEFDNQNQIITTNKDTLNMYEYFNKKFFRLVKGLNKLKLKTLGGTCTVTINCQFLRKVGGR